MKVETTDIRPTLTEKELRILIRFLDEFAPDSLIHPVLVMQGIDTEGSWSQDDKDTLDAAYAALHDAS